MATRIDHSGHPHPSTPAARALCRANGGTGSIVKTGTDVPKTKSVVKPTSTKRAIQDAGTGTTISREEAAKRMFGTQVTKRQPGLTEKKVPVPKKTTPAPKRSAGRDPIGHETKYTPKHVFDQVKKQPIEMKDKDGRWQLVDLRGISQAPAAGGNNRVGQWTFKTKDGTLIRRATGNEELSIRPAVARTQATDVKPSTGTRTTLPGVGRVSTPAADKDYDARFKAKVSSAVPASMGEAFVRVAKVHGGLVGNDYVDAAVGKVRQGVYNPDNDKQTANAFANFVFADRSLNLHKDLERRGYELTKCQHSGWHNQGGAESIDTVIAHEIAHGLASSDSMEPQGWQTLLDGIAADFDAPEAPPKFTGFGGKRAAYVTAEAWFQRQLGNPSFKRKVREGISRYGASNLNEFIAESWSGFSMNPKPNRRTKRMGELLKTIMTTGQTDVRRKA